MIRIRGEEPTIRRIPRPRRQVGPATLRLARIFGFRHDEARDAYVLRLVGNRVGPVLRSAPPVDSAAAQIEWSESMDQLAARRRPGRFAAEREPAERVQQDLLKR